MKPQAERIAAAGPPSFRRKETVQGVFDLAADAPLLIDGGSLYIRLIIPAMAIVAIATASAAEARPKRERTTQAQVTCDMRGCSDNPTAQAATTRQRAHTRRDTGAALTQIADANGNGTIIGGRPSGCPHRFCGCEASRYVFGEIRPELNLAANWARKFPRTAPASGMVAARSGHVMVLMSHAGGDEWLVHDGNSGGGRTREHVRSIRGYTIVNPRATVTAQN